MLYIKSKEDINNVPHIPREVYQALDGLDCISHLLIMENGDNPEELRKHGLDPDCLYAGYNEVVEGKDTNYYLSVFFQATDYIVLIMPDKPVNQGFLETYYSHVSYEDITDFGEAYYNLEHDLANSYTPEQMKLYVELEGLKEAAISGMAENIYKKAFKNAITIIYEGKEDL